MNHADELEVAGEQAARLAGNFGQSTSDLSIRSIHLEQAARSLTMGSGRWASLASQAFFGAWS
ncbi:MAG TPA: hypothetical protein VFV38_32770, partial [Ktedonobacteraceae bacterium]|nr:hypothetical protein [Ktedonobacteraceae bacterium]